MKRLAIAVLLVLFVLSTALPATIAPQGTQDAMLPFGTNPGLQSEDGMFDEFTQTVVVRANPLDHVIADLNNDTILDLAIIYDGSNFLDIFLADGSFVFSSTPSRTITFDWQPTGLASGDMDRDDKADLVVCLDYDSGENIIICYQKNDFSKTSPAAKYFYNSLKQKDVLLSDLNGDGWLDVVALYSMDDPGYQAGFTVYRSTTPNNYSQTIKPLPLEMYSPDLITMGDFNGDGRQDLVIGDAVAEKVAGYRNNASTGASWTLIGPVNDVIATSLMIEQMAGDGREELVMALAQNPPATDSSIIRVLRYTNASGLFTEFVDEVPNQPDVTAMTTVLNDQDGTLDLVRTSYHLHNLTIFNTPTGSPIWRYSGSISSPTPANPVSVLSSDMNNDGYGDLIVICNSSEDVGTFTVYYHSSAAISNANDNLVLGSIDSVMSTSGDFNGDGIIELAFYEQSTMKAHFYRTSYTSLGQLAAPSAATVLKAGDLNGDGKDELIWANSTSVIVWWGSAAFFSSTTSSVLNVTMLPRSLGFGDLDDDGMRELVVGCNGGVEVYWNLGTTAPFSASNRFVLILNGSEVGSVEVGMLTGDGDDLADIAIVNASSSRIEIYHQQASSPVFTSASRSLLTIVPNIDDLVSEDFNGDGRSDLVTHSNETLYLFLQYGGGFSGAPEFPLKYVPGQGIDGLALGNLDDQGTKELALISENSTLMVLHYNATSSGLQTITTQTVGASPSVIMTGDVNGDGKDDLISYSTSSRTVSFYYQNNFPPIAVGEVEGLVHYEGETIWFNANGSTDSLSDISDLTYEWDFDDGTTGTGVRTGHVFDDNGTFNVTLNVSDPWGAWDEMVIIVEIGDRFPMADFAFQQEPSPIEGSPVQFYDLSASDPDDIVRWQWDFGDGEWMNYTVNQSVQHTYDRNDEFIVTLTIYDEDGSPDSMSRNITVADSSPTADFITSTSSPYEGQNISFTDQSTFTADDIIKWSWDFGDGNWYNTTIDEVVHHTYSHNGTYTVTLYVIDEDGDDDSLSKVVVVRNSVPSVDFVISNISPDEGDDLTFSISSVDTLNPIVRWSWDMDDGTWFNRTANESVQYSYDDNGSYNITLTVMDIDGDSYSITRELVVKDTSPSITRLYTLDGSLTYNEGDLINFATIATPDWEEIDKYQWDFQTTSFDADVETELNSTYWQYNSSGTLKAGTYKVTVRVWDSDSFAETSITVTINDPSPVPDFTSHGTGNPREIGFSGALTTDTENDWKCLQYRWFFGDGQQTDWNSSYEVVHTYLDDGVYSVRLEVKDDHSTASKSSNVTIDLLPPIISITDPVLKAEVGKPILVRVNVTDQVGIGSVVLEYTVNNVTKTIVMTSEGGDEYFAQIPELNDSAEISYRIIAEDRAGHTSETDLLSISVEYEDPTLFMLTSALLLAALIVLLGYLFLSRPIVDEVFVMYQDGTLLAHQTRRLKPGMDDQILGGMLIALQNFVRDSFKDESSTVLRRMDFGERKILVERKDDFFMAVVLSGKRAGSAPQRMMKVLDQIEEGYSQVLNEWDGDLDKVRGIRDETKPIFQRANPLERLKRKEGDGDSF